jgi:hypothetical protein
MCIEHATYGATYDAIVLLRFRVDWTRKAPTSFDMKCRVE